MMEGGRKEREKEREQRMERKKKEAAVEKNSRGVSSGASGPD